MDDMLLGIDLGTSSAKAVFFGTDGSVVGEDGEVYGIDSPRPGWAEQDPEIWWNAVAKAVRKAKKAIPGPFHLSGMGISGQMHGLVCLDRSKKVLRPAVIWADQRSGDEASQINSFLDDQCLFKNTLNKASSGFMLSSLLWLRQNEPEIARRIAHVLLPKDYIRFRLTEELSTDPSDACGSAAFDVVNGQWMDGLLRHFAINPSIMPYVTYSSLYAGELCREAAETLDLKPGIPVASGAGDQAAQAIGNGLIRSGQASSNIGTAGQFFVASEKPLYDPELRCNCFNHAEFGMWYLLGANLSAGFCLNWLWTKILGRQNYDEAAAWAAEVPAGSRGLLFHPYLNGDRTPHQDPLASASFIGLSGTHGISEMVRAVMEGVVFSLRDGLDIARSLGLSPSLVVASGGGARSALWRQIQADVYNLPVGTMKATEQACAGAAILGGVAAGVFDSIGGGCARMIGSVEEVTEPIPANAALYEEIYQSAYRDFYTQNRELYAKLFKWRNRH